MKPIFQLLTASFLTGVLFIARPIRADQDASKDRKADAPTNAKAHLEKGKAAGSFPEGMIVRVDACLGEAVDKAEGDREPNELREHWEFTSDRVHRVVLDSKEGKTVYNRIESRQFY